MTAVLTDDDYFKLHMDNDGCVWFADGVCKPIKTTHGIDAIIDAITPRNPLYVRVLGLPANAAMITALYSITASPNRMQVASPRICENARYSADDGFVRHSPAMLLREMRRDNVNAASGGWHTTNAHDYLTYQILAALHRIPQQDLPMPPELTQMIAAHPVFRYWQFITGLTEHHAGWLMYCMVDPRWHVDPAKPDRMGCLRTFMGATPGTYAKLKRGCKSACVARCYAVLTAWQNPVAAATPLDAPGMFLHRIAGRGEQGDRGVIRACGKMLTYLRYTWLHAIHADTRYSGAHGLFAPDMYFKTDAEIAAYLAHVDS